ncbi:transcription termination factor 1 [Phyllobates terribilis]|uniref:transcription termination factor 1 n=1 Tax=Phyllobates terribilis TaxID=111132 RepID=UPI003CCAE95C
MSMNVEEKLKHRDRTPHRDISNHEPSGPENQVITGDELKKKKKKFTNFNVMCMGSSSDAEGTPKRTKYEQHSETETVPPVPKRKKKGDVYIEDQTDQEISRKKKKKKRKDESHQEAEDTRAIEKIKKSRKAKESKSGHSNEEVPGSKIADLDGRSRTKKKKKKKDLGEHPLDDCLVEESLTVDSQSANEKKKTKRKDGGEESHSQRGFTKRKHRGGFETTRNVNESEDQAEDGSVQELLISETQHSSKKKKKRKDSGRLQEDGFSEEIFSQQKSPNGSETLEQEEGINQKRKPVKKKKSKPDHHQVADDIAVDADASSSFVGLRIETSLCSELIAIEHGLSRKKKKKSKKDHGNHPMDGLMEESMTISTADANKSAKKTKWEDGHESQRQHMQEGQSVDQAKAHGKKKKKHSGERLLDDRLAEDLCSVDAQDTKKMTKRTDDEDEGHRQHSFTATTESVAEFVHYAQVRMKKKKELKKYHREPHQDTDLTADDMSSSVGLHSEEPSFNEFAGTEDNVSRKKKKKSKKDGLLDDCLVEESTLTDKHISEMKTKLEDGGDESQRQHMQEGLSVDQAEAHGKKKKKHRGERLLDDRLAEDLCNVDTQDTKKTTKRTDDGDEGHRQRSFTATTEPVAVCVDEAEVRMKKKKKTKKDRSVPHQDTDLTADDVSSSVGLHSEEPSSNEFAGTEDSASRKNKKKSKKHHKDRLLEYGLVEELSTAYVQHKSDKRAKWKDGGHESHRHHGFTEEFGTKRKHQSGSEKKDLMDENEEVEKPVKKKKKQKDEHPKEADDTAEDEGSSAVGLCREEPSRSEFTGTEDKSRRLKKEKSNKYHRECFLENGLVEEHTEQSHRPQSSASPLVDPNPATQDEHQATQNKGEEKLATLEADTERRRIKKSIPKDVREQDIALLQEYLPRMNNPNALKYLCCSELERVKAAKRSGILFRSGQFTVEEDEIIRNNAQEFASRIGIESPVMLFHPYLFPEVSNTLSKLKTKYRFRTRLVDGLHRFACHVYGRGVKLFSPVSTRGRFSNEEVAQLKMYREAFGRKWQMIATALNRNSDSIRMKATQLHEGNHGVWSTEETNRLITAVKESVVDTLRKEKNGEELVTVPKRRLYTGIPWFVVERKVQTRIWTSCRVRWCNLMLMRMNNYINPFGKTLKMKSFIKVILWLYDKNVKDYGDVKWEELSNHIGNVPTTEMQRMFHTLKKGVSGWRDMRLYEIVKNLYDDTLPELKEKLLAAGEIDIEPETKDEFLISEIFQEYQECGEKFEA